MVPAFSDALNPFQQAFSDAEDFIDILRQANPEFASFYDPLSSELAGLEQVADSWIQLSLQSFAPAGLGDSMFTAIAQNSLNSSVAVPSAQDFVSSIGGGDTQGVQVPYVNPIPSDGGPPIGTGGLPGGDNPYVLYVNPIASGGGPSIGTGGLPGGDIPYVNPIPSGGDLSTWIGNPYVIFPGSTVPA